MGSENDGCRNPIAHEILERTGCRLLVFVSMAICIFSSVISRQSLQAMLA